MCTALETRNYKRNPYLPQEHRLIVGDSSETTSRGNKTIISEIETSKMRVVIFVALCFVSSLICIEADEPMAEIQRKGLIYILQQAGSNFYKVGFTSRNVNSRLKELQGGNPNKIVPVYQQRVKNVGQAEKAAKDSVKNFHVHPRLGGGVEWYEVPRNRKDSFINTIERAIGRFKGEKESLLQQIITQMLNQQ